MTLHTGSIVIDAYQKGYAVPAFSIHTYNLVDEICNEAEDQQMLVLLSVVDLVVDTLLGPALGACAL